MNTFFFLFSLQFVQVVVPATGITKAQSSSSREDIQIAMYYLTTPAGTTELIPNEETWPLIRDSIQYLATKLEILDSRETSYIMAKRSDFDTDINLLRRRYIEFEDSPKLLEANRLPDRKIVNEFVLFNRAYRRHLIDRHALEQDRSNLFIKAIKDTDYLYKVWDAVRDARCEFYYVTVRRQALKRLKDMLGEEAYYTADLPPNVPTWFFNEVDK